MSSFSATHWIIAIGLLVVIAWGIARLITSAAKMRDYWKGRSKKL